MCRINKKKRSALIYNKIVLIQVIFNYINALTLTFEQTHISGKCSVQADYVITAGRLPSSLRQQNYVDFKISYSKRVCPQKTYTVYVYLHPITGWSLCSPDQSSCRKVTCCLIKQIWHHGECVAGCCSDHCCLSIHPSIHQ